MSRTIAGVLFVLLGLTAAASAEARQLGSISVIRDGGWEVDDDNDGYIVCTAHLRRPNPSGSDPKWSFHTVKANTAAACQADVERMKTDKWDVNPNPGASCVCTGGFYGVAYLVNEGDGPLGEAPLSDQGQLIYQEAVRELRQRYNLRGFAQEHQMLLDSIRATEPPSE